MILFKILINSLILRRNSLSVKAKAMDVLRNFQTFSWCKPDWCSMSMSKETNELLKQCVGLPHVQFNFEVDDIVRKSKEFPVKFPIETVRLEKLKVRRPIEKLKRNVISTYPVIHERVLLLMTHFLVYKREYGSSIEKAFYKDMTIPELIDRLLKKRAVMFMGANDYYKLLTGETDEDGWEAVGTLQQRPPLILENCLSYDEMKLSSMVYVSGPTECINNGTRHNKGVVHEEDSESDAVIIGIIGPRFERESRMEYEDVLITEQQNCLENGYGEEVTPTTCLNVLKTTYVRNNQSAKHMWRQMWAEFYQVHSYTYDELTSYVTIEDKAEESRYSERYVKVPRTNIIFDNEVYYKRISITAESILLEAQARGHEGGRKVFLNVIGAGLGVWKISPHQPDVYVLTFLERIRALLRKDQLNNVSDVNFAYIRPSSGILALFTSVSSPDGEPSQEQRIFFESKRHPSGGINVQLENREPSAKLVGEHEGKLLVMTYPWDGNAHPGNEFCAVRSVVCAFPSQGYVITSSLPLVMTYPWDGNAHPGNEFWIGSLNESGDPAAACSTQVAELHNAHVNPAVAGHNTRVLGTLGLLTLQEYCTALPT